ncbi:MAG: hypothetical protein QOI10_2438 [Solirubrobacterales bacterium]|jgi:hypothetical protein|nr:hypothetical protein [Solirubrobacterales bacterium]
MGPDHLGVPSRARVALIAIAAVALAGCGSGQQQPATTSADQPVTPSTDPAQVEAAPAALPPAPERLTLQTPPGAYPVIWVKVHQEVEMRTEPGGGELIERIGRESPFGSPSVFGVVDKRGPWAGVTTSLLPNNQLGWIKLDPQRIEYGWTKYSITVDLSERRAALAKGDRVELSFPVTVGAPGADTPSGRFAVSDTFTGLDSAAYGCCALALSATQPNLPSGWLGGRTIAIHGTSGPLGIAASHGCVRAADASVAKLVHTIPLGTPVFIRA